MIYDMNDPAPKRDPKMDAIDTAPKRAASHSSTKAAKSEQSYSDSGRGHVRT